MSEKKINSHIIQRAFAKNFAIDGKIHWERYKTDEGGVFNINSKAKRQPIAEYGYYSYDIEKGMNDIEQDGMSAMQKIIKGVRENLEVELTRKDVNAIKFFSSISSARTNKIRLNMENLDGDHLFNKIISDSGMSPKEAQEEMIRVMIECYGEYKTHNPLTRDKVRLKRRGKHTIKSSTYASMWTTEQSSMHIIIFEKEELILSEAICFTEQNRKTGGILLQFLPIAPDIGIVLYFSDPLFNQDSLHESFIFENEFKYNDNFIVYKREDEINERFKEYVIEKRKNPNLSNEEIENTFTGNVLVNFFDDKDEFIYQVQREKSPVAILCNAMALIHNHKSIHIFQDKKDVLNAEEMAIKEKICRVEDLRRS